jgi:hypothetical protein
MVVVEKIIFVMIRRQVANGTFEKFALMQNMGCTLMEVAKDGIQSGFRAGYILYFV